MTVRRVVLYEPGHFHAALLFRTPNPRLARDIHVYATPGPERDAFTGLVESFNQRPEQPTGWTLHLHSGDDLLERLIADGHGDVAVLAGRNNTKLALIARLTRAHCCRQHRRAPTIVLAPPYAIGCRPGHRPG